MLTRIVSSFLIAASVGWIALPGNAQDRAPACSRIGRFHRGESDNYDEDDIVCSGAQILNPVGVEFLCFSNRALIPLTETTIIDSAFCAQNAEPTGSLEPTQCSEAEIIRRWLCVVYKGPEDSLQFSVLQPDVVSGQRPQIAWEEISSATTYTVYVASTDISWRRTIDAAATELAYPSEEASLTLGNAYEVLVTANLDDDQIAVSIPKTINVSNVTQQIEIQLAARINEAQ